jgi:FtsP/CotA-like multicopper oxidase with cupredoxin domain
MTSNAARKSAARPRRRAATWITAGVAAGASALVIGMAGCSGIFGGGVVNTVGAVDFDTPLAIPPLAEAAVDGDGTHVFHLRAQAGSTDVVPAGPTTTWGFNQDYLGPTIVADRGDKVRVDVTNALDEPTTVHWHGMHLPAKMDGGPHQMIEPGSVWSPEWAIDQPAATLWYHPHPHGETEHQVEMGLAGMVILHDDEERALNLPRTYGVDDIPVIVQDKRFTADGQFSTGTRGFVGPVGDQLLVNGTLGPFLAVTTDAVRLRLLNGSSARTYNFAFADGERFDLIGTDGGLLAAPLRMDGIRLSPGERAEILVRLAPGQSATLQSTPPDLGIQDAVAAMNGGGDTLDVLQLRAAAQLTPLGRTPATLASFDRISERSATVQRSFSLDGTEINGKPMDLARIDETVEAGSTEIWTVRNNMSMPHSFHVHDVQFQLLSVAGAAPPGELAGWKDTVYLEPQTEYRLIMSFGTDTDRSWPYMYHCHLLAHEDSGMMGQFVVVQPGQSAGTPPTGHEAKTTTNDGHGPRTEETDHDH